MPIRVQRKRTKGYSIEGAVYVGRPTVYGNPFKIMGDMIYGNASHRRKIFSPWIYIDPDNNQEIDWTKPLAEIVLELYRNWLNGKDNNYLVAPLNDEQINRLKGKDLCCWCKIGEPCHADILLKLANP